LVNLYLTWNATKDVVFTASVDNLLNQDPPMVPGTSYQGQNVYYFTATRGDIYDLIGRAVRIGVRVRL